MMDFIANKLHKYYDARVRHVEGEPQRKRFRSKTAARFLTGALLFGSGSAGFAEACVLKNNFWHREMTTALAQAHLVEPDQAAVTNAETVLISFRGVQSPSTSEVKAVRQAEEIIVRKKEYERGYELVEARVHEEPDPIPIALLASASIITAAATMIPMSFIIKERQARKENAIKQGIVEDTQ